MIKRERNRSLYVRKLTQNLGNNKWLVHMYCTVKECKSVKAVIEINGNTITKKYLSGKHLHKPDPNLFDNVFKVDNNKLIETLNENAKKYKFTSNSSNNLVCKREPCDVKHENIQNYDKLWVYYHSDRKFRLVSRSEFPKKRGTICQLCPSGEVRENKSLIFCQTKVESWTAFKSHLSIVERAFAEKVAFPGDFKETDLPNISNYNLKYRQIGQLGDDLQKSSFYIFDIQENKFILMQREEIGNKYTNDGVCNYCPCTRKLKSPLSFLSHIQTLENRYFCYLILQDLKENDKRNQEKLDVFVNRIKEDVILFSNKRELRELLNQQQSFNDNKLDDFEENLIEKEDNDGSSEYLSINGDFNDDRMEASYLNNYALEDDNIHDPLKLVDVIEKVFKNDCRKFGAYFNQLKSKVNICSLDESLINSQEQLILIKNDEDSETNEKNLSFTKDLNLEADDLSSLFSKHDVPDSFRIKNISLTLNLNLKPKDNSMINNQLNTSFGQSNLNNLPIENNDRRPQRAKRSIPFRTRKQSVNGNLDDSFSSIENNEPNEEKMNI